MGIDEQSIKKVIEKYPLLVFYEEENTFRGRVTLNHIYNDIRMTGEFNIEIIVLKEYPLVVPIVKELSNEIDREYAHCYANGELCLACNIELKRFFNQNADISKFIEAYIIPYLYTYRFYETYGIYPYGERSHGNIGELEYLKDLFMVDSLTQVKDILTYIEKSSYRGHVDCPCGSGKRLRKCHGEVIKEIMNTELRDECIKVYQGI